MEIMGKALVVGAGPVGLGAAVFLQRAGISTRIIDAAEKPSTYSKALAVNPRTLEILESTGVTEKMLALGLPIRGARIRRGEKVLAEMKFDRLRHKYPFMLALSQATTERLLTEALETAGGKVERGTELVTCRNATEGVEAELKHAPQGVPENVRCPWLFAADGAHSATRRTLNIAFQGASFANPWHLMDVPLKTPLESELAHGFFCDDGFLFLIRVIDNASSRSMDPAVWRVISNRKELLREIPRSEICGSPIWESEFHIAHRINELLQAGNVYFGGDAAHIHSPMGARGMNLGLEDAWVFSELARQCRMERYATLRKPVDQQVVKRVERLSRAVQGETAFERTLRTLAIQYLAKLGSIKGSLMEALTGLDHALEPPLESSAPGSERSERQYNFKPGKHSHAH